jgi:hypothetical protein
VLVLIRKQANNSMPEPQRQSNSPDKVACLNRVRLSQQTLAEALPSSLHIFTEYSKGLNFVI